MPEPMTIGAKTNALCDAAESEIIAHFDDDDFYGHAGGHHLHVFYICTLARAARQSSLSPSISDQLFIP